MSYYFDQIHAQVRNLTASFDIYATFKTVTDGKEIDINVHCPSKFAALKIYCIVLC